MAQHDNTIRKAPEIKSESQSAIRNEIVVSARTLDKAIESAAIQLKVSPERVEYRIVSHTKGGFFAFLGRKIEIAARSMDERCDSKSTNLSAARSGERSGENSRERSTQQEPSRSRTSRRDDLRDGDNRRDNYAPTKEREVKDFSTKSSSARSGRDKGAGENSRSDREAPAALENVDRSSSVLTPEELTVLMAELKVFCIELVGRILNSTDSELAPEVEVDLKLDEDRMIFAIKSNEFAAMVMKNAKLAEALEHLIRKKPRHLKRELPFRVFVDVNQIRADRERELIELAQEMSHKVVENQRAVVLDYRNSYDRKVIHMALDKDPQVFTKSVGSGPNRKLMILPASGRYQAEADFKEVDED